MIAGAACDVFEKEPPLDKNHPLLHSPNIIVTPHIALASVESMEQRAEIMFQILYSWLEGKQINPVRLKKDYSGEDNHRKQHLFITSLIML